MDMNNIKICYIQEMGKIMDMVVKDTHFSINMEFSHYLPLIQLVFFSE